MYGEFSSTTKRTAKQLNWRTGSACMLYLMMMMNRGLPCFQFEREKNRSSEKNFTITSNLRESYYTWENKNEIQEAKCIRNNVHR